MPTKTPKKDNIPSWRKAVGWVFVLAMVLEYIIAPLVGWASVILGWSIPAIPSLGDHVWELMAGVLGLGGLRTWEKGRGVAS